MIALLGFHPKAILNFQLGLFLGIFPMFIPAYLAQERLLSELSRLDRLSYVVHRRIILANAPAWLQKMYKMLGYYFFAFFAVFAYRTFPNKATTELDEVLLLSVGAALFYSGFAANLTSYAGTEHPLRLDEI